MSNGQKTFKSKSRNKLKDFAISNALKDAGAKNTKATLALLDMDKVSVDEDGQLFGLSEQLEKLQKQMPIYLHQSKKKNRKKVLLVCLLVVILVLMFLKILKNMSLDEQTELYRKDPAQWQSLFGNK